MSGPPFEPYPASAASVRERSCDLIDHADQLPPIIDAVGQAGSVAQSAVSGFLVGPLGLGPNRFARRADRFRLTLLYTAACLGVYADAVGAFNWGIDRLNEIWRAAIEYGIPAVSPDAARTPDGATDTTRLSDLADARAEDVAAARAELEVRLRSRYQRMEMAFDQAASDVAEWIRRGPNPDDFRELVDDGVLRDLLDSMPVDQNTLGVHEGSCDPQGYSSCGYRVGDDPGFWATAKEIGSLPWRAGTTAADYLYLDDARAAWNGDPAAAGFLLLDVVGGPISRAARELRHADDAVEAIHDAENAEDAVDAAGDIGHAGRHQFPETLPRKSQFYDDVDLASLSKSQPVVGFPQPNGNMRYVMRSEYDIGVDRTTGVPTQVYTVIRGPDGRVVTMYPGTSPRS